MIEIQQGEQTSGTLERLMRQLADARRNLAATEQARLDLEQRLERTEPMAIAAHAYCAAVNAQDAGLGRYVDVVQTGQAMFDVHQAQTPSQGGA